MEGAVPREIWVVHDRHAEGVMARKWLIHRGSYLPANSTVRGPNLEVVRAKLPPGLTRRDRAPGDAPSIVEIWV